MEIYYKLPLRVRKFIRNHIIPLKYDEIHIERINETFNKLIKWIKKHPETMLMPTFSIKPPSRKVLEKYRYLVENFENSFGLHVYISNGLYSPPPPLQDYKTQYEIIKRGLEYLRELGVETIDFTSGNWNYNYDTFIACRELGLINVHIKLKEIPKITEKHGIPKGIRIIPVVRHLHDYDIP